MIFGDNGNVYAKFVSAPNGKWKCHMVSAGSRHNSRTSPTTKLAKSGLQPWFCLNKHSRRHTDTVEHNRRAVRNNACNLKTLGRDSGSVWLARAASTLLSIIAKSPSVDGTLSPPAATAPECENVDARYNVLRLRTVCFGGTQRCQVTTHEKIQNSDSMLRDPMEINRCWSPTLFPFDLHAPEAQRLKSELTATSRCGARLKTPRNPIHGETIRGPAHRKSSLLLNVR